jgi:hypothetical protein
LPVAAAASTLAGLKIASQGGDIIGGTPAEFAAFLKTDTVRWAKLIKDANIKAD